MTTSAPGIGAGRGLDDLLARYAAGRLSTPLHILVAGHLSLVPESRTFVHDLDAMNGVALETIAPVPVANREAKLDEIFEPCSTSAGPTRFAPWPGILPAPIAAFLGCGIEALRWRSLLPGVKECKVQASEQGEAVLYWLKPGQTMPCQTREGSEYTLVLKGGFSDARRHYRRGDIATAGRSPEDRLTADGGEDCICYTVTDAPLRFTSPAGRTVQRLFKPS
ncbi:MAG TPA: ChrR family anti-sigma-E factor [Microvirga sp.]|nr:ChrR family anti-sigma-E factor [Microvirga sp.]